MLEKRIENELQALDQASRSSNNDEVERILKKIDKLKKDQLAVEAQRRS